MRSDDHDVSEIGSAKIINTAAAKRPRVITVPEAGATCGLGRAAAYEAARRGELPTLRFGRRLVVPLDRLEALLRGTG